MKRWRRAVCLLMAVAMAVILGGCRKREDSPQKKSEKEYGEAETMMIVTTEKLRYEELYTDQIWMAAVDNRGTTFEAALLSQIHDFLRELKIMSQMAEEEKLVLSSREKELVKTAARQYLSALGEETAGDFGLDEQLVEAFYTDYWVSEKLVEELTGGMDLEVSDSEAKVISVTEIRLDTRDEAERVLEKALSEGSNFTSLAKEYSKDPEVKKQIFRGMYGAGYEEAAYGLSEGEISGILSDSGSYYIIKCTDDYDETATRAHKEQMILEKKNEAFYSAYQNYKEGISLSGDETFWQELSVSNSPSVQADFFQIFDLVCLGQ